MGKRTKKYVRRKIVWDLMLAGGLSGALFWLDVYTSIPDQVTVACEDHRTEMFQDIVP